MLYVLHGTSLKMKVEYENMKNYQQKNRKKKKGTYPSQQSRIQSHASLVNVIEFNIKKLQPQDY
jgi:hypothetical protein